MQVRALRPSSSERRPKRRRKKKGTVDSRRIAATVGTACSIGFLCAIVSAAVFRRKQDENVPPFLSTASSSSSALNSIPENIPNLWPDRKNQEKLLSEMLMNCLPFENPQCQERKTGSKRRAVGVFRPPSVLGKLFEEFVVQFVELHRTKDTDVVVVGTSHIDDDEEPSFTSILRAAVLPAQLEAVDLALQATGDDFSPHQISRQDYLGVAKQWSRWHCRLNKIAAQNTALYTVSFDQMMAYPGEVEKELAAFLGLALQEDKHVEMDEIAEKVFDRVDACTKVIMELDKNGTGSTTEVLMGQTILEELDTGDCRTASLLGDDIVPSRVTEIVGHFLDAVPPPPIQVCGAYPEATLCRESIVERLVTG